MVVVAKTVAKPILPLGKTAFLHGKEQSNQFKAARPSYTAKHIQRTVWAEAAAAAALAYEGRRYVITTVRP